MDAQADLSLRWAHTQFVSFVMSRLKLALCIFRLCMREIDNIVPGQRSTGIKKVNGVSVILCSHSFIRLRTDFGEYFKLK